MESARQVLEGVASDTLAAEPGYLCRLLCIQAYVSVRRDEPQAAERITEVIRLADRQGAKVWANYARVLAGIQSRSVGAALLALPERARSVLSMLAEPIAEELSALDIEAATVVMAEVASRPERWRPVVRRLVSSRGSKSRVEAARILDIIGEVDDVPLLRSVARESRRTGIDPHLGRGLARRLAERVHVEDLGRLVISGWAG